jgi:N-acetylneuraminic acid mutarotase
MVMLLLSMIFTPTPPQDCSWIEIDQSPGPGIRICAGMAYDSESGVIVLHGGYDGSSASRETWAFDCRTNEWRRMSCAEAPRGRLGQGFVYDEIRDRCMMFFGTDGHLYFNDTWEYDFNSNTWTRLHPGTSPSPRCKGGAAFDTESRQIIFFGGYGADEENLSETWTFNIQENTWVDRTTDEAPPPRKRNPLSYDEDDDRVVMFGGWLEGNHVLGDTWTYDFNSNTWAEIHTGTSPAPRARFGTVYDSETRNVLISHGFQEREADLDDTWEFSVENGEWRQLDTEGLSMPARHCFQMVYDVLNQRVVAQGGAEEIAYDCGTWVLEEKKAKAAR